MAYERKEGDVSIFKNKKEKDTQPDYKGKALVNGSEMYISLWVKTSQSGEKFFSGKIEPRRDAAPAPAPVAEDPFTNDLPF